MTLSYLTIFYLMMLFSKLSICQFRIETPLQNSGEKLDARADIKVEKISYTSDDSFSKKFPLRTKSTRKKIFNVNGKKDRSSHAKEKESATNGMTAKELLTVTETPSIEQTLPPTELPTVNPTVEPSKIGRAHV